MYPFASLMSNHAGRFRQEFLPCLSKHHRHPVGRAAEPAGSMKGKKKMGQHLRLSLSDLFYGVSTTEGDWFSRLPEMETPRLLLRKIRRRDAADLFEWCSDDQVARYVLWDAHEQISETRSYIRQVRAAYRHGLPSSWAIVLKSSRKVIGTIGFMWFSRENRSAEVGYSLARSCWGQGYMTEALSRVLRAAFEDLKLNRVEAQYDVRNPASGRVMEKSGMRHEGILRNRILNKGEYVDVGICSMIASDRKSGAAERVPSSASRPPEPSSF